MIIADPFLACSILAAWLIQAAPIISHIILVWFVVGVLVRLTMTMMIPDWMSGDPIEGAIEIAIWPLIVVSLVWFSFTPNSDVHRNELGE